MLPLRTGPRMLSFFNQLNAKKMAEDFSETLKEIECEYIDLFIR